MKEETQLTSRSNTDNGIFEKEWITNSTEETFALAEKFANELKGGELILFEAQMGAGKTHFVKGLLEALDFDPDEVTSPSFSLVNKYETDPVVYHLDLWRIDEKSDPSFAVGLPELLEDEDSIVIIEWAEKLRKEELSSPYIVITIEVLDEDSRRFTFSKT